MKKLIPIIALIPLTLLALTPPWVLELTCDVNGLVWLWAVLISGFLTFLFLYQKVSVWLRLLVVWLFTSCFLSCAPFISFTMFWSVIACAYYYALCRRIENYTPVKKTIQAVFLLTCLLFIMQSLRLDTLLNFATKDSPMIYGMIGNKMISASFVCIIAPFILTPFNLIAMFLISFLTTSSGAVLSLGTGLAVYGWQVRRLRLLIVALAIIGSIAFAYSTGKFYAFTLKGIGGGRAQVWVETSKLIAKRPLGYGVGVYKKVFPVLTPKIHPKDYPLQWNTAHNDWLQIPFEIGIPGFILLLGWLVSIVRNVLNEQNYLKLAGLSIIATNMIIHFPTRMSQCVLIILMYLAYCEKGDLKWLQ